MKPFLHIGVRIALILFACQSWPEARAEDDDPSAFGSVEAAVEALNADNHQTREAASRYLWRLGDPALPHLKTAAGSGDPEVAFRARELITKIASGVRPDMATSVATLLERYRATRDVTQRVATLKSLFADRKDGVKAAVKLLADETDAKVVTTVLGWMHQAQQFATLRWCLTTGRMEEARALIEVAAEHYGAMREVLVLLWLLEGRLDEEIARREAAIKDSTRVDKYLPPLYRAKGELAKAVEAGSNTNAMYEPIQLQQMLGQWESLADRYKEPSTAIERLGYRAAYCRLAGDLAGMNLAFRVFEERVKRTKTESSHIVEAFLVTDWPQRAVDFCIQLGKPLESARVLVAQSRYADLRRLVKAAGGFSDLQREGLARLVETIPAADADLLRDRPDRREDPVPSVPEEEKKQLMAEGQSRQLAARYAELAERAPYRALPLYLQGWALSQGDEGNKAEGKALMDRAVLLSYLPSPVFSRYDFIRGLETEGLFEDAAKMWDLALKIPGFDRACSQIALLEFGPDRAAKAKRYGDAANYVESARLRVLRPVVSITDTEWYLGMALHIAWLRAHDAVERKDWDAAMDQALVAHDVYPSDIELPMWLLPLMEKANRKRDADQVLDLKVAFLKDLCKACPGVGSYHNTLAWLLARCRKDLATARTYAETAVKLEPKSGAYLDTLAEVMFQLGETETAIELIKKAIALGKDMDYLQRQLKRFKAGDSATDPQEPGTLGP